MKANIELKNHGFPLESFHTVKVEHSHDSAQIVELTEAVVERIRELAAKVGVDPAPLLIEATPDAGGDGEE